MLLNYKILTLQTMLAAYGDDDKVNDELSEFACYRNPDVENFLHYKAIIFDKQSISKTHLVYTSFQSQMVLVGYFTLSNKNFVIKNNTQISKTLKKKIVKFGHYDDILRQYIISAPLIGQLGKNDAYADLISGDILLSYACDEVRKAQAIVGGKYVYLECEDSERLKEFYKANGFVEFGKRELDPDEKNDIGGKYLIQLLRDLKS